MKKLSFDRQQVVSNDLLFFWQFDSQLTGGCPDYLVGGSDSTRSFSSWKLLSLPSPYEDAEFLKIINELEFVGLSEYRSDGLVFALCAWLSGRSKMRKDRVSRVERKDFLPRLPNL